MTNMQAENPITAAEFIIAMGAELSSDLARAIVEQADQSESVHYGCTCDQTEHDAESDGEEWLCYCLDCKIERATCSFGHVHEDFDCTCYDAARIDASYVSTYIIKHAGIGQYNAPRVTRLERDGERERVSVGTAYSDLIENLITNFRAENRRAADVNDVSVWLLQGGVALVQVQSEGSGYASELYIITK